MIIFGVSYSSIGAIRGHRALILEANLEVG
jgi:hypothetical protein